MPAPDSAIEAACPFWRIFGMSRCVWHHDIPNSVAGLSGYGRIGPMIPTRNSNNLKLTMLGGPGPVRATDIIHQAGRHSDGKGRGAGRCRNRTEIMQACRDMKGGDRIGHSHAMDQWQFRFDGQADRMIAKAANRALESFIGTGMRGRTAFFCCTSRDRYRLDAIGGTDDKRDKVLIGVATDSGRGIGKRDRRMHKAEHQGVCQQKARDSNRQAASECRIYLAGSDHGFQSIPERYLPSIIP